MPTEIRPFGFVQLGESPAPEPEAVVEEVEAPDIDAIIAEARSEGQELGYREGIQRGLEEQRATVERLANIAAHARADAREFTRLLEQQVVGLALAIAKKVVERELTTDPSLVVDVVRSAITEVQDSTSIHVRVHPDDAAIIEPHWHAIGRNVMGEPIILVADERVEPGGCLIETAIGHVDGQLSTRFNQVASLVGAVLDGEPS